MPTCCSAWRHPIVQKSLHSRVVCENNQRSLQTRVSPACKSYQENSRVSLGGDSIGYKSLGNNSSTATHIAFHYAFFTLELLATTGFHRVEGFTSERFEPRRRGWLVWISSFRRQSSRLAQCSSLTLERENHTRCNIPNLTKLYVRLATTAHS